MTTMHPALAPTRNSLSKYREFASGIDALQKRTIRHWMAGTKAAVFEILDGCEPYEEVADEEALASCVCYRWRYAPTDEAAAELLRFAATHAVEFGPHNLSHQHRILTLWLVLPK